MGWLSGWLAEWRETYEAYPAATAVIWTELLLGILLIPVALLYPAIQPRLPWTVGAALVVLGAAFVVWFTVLRGPVMDRLV